MDSDTFTARTLEICRQRVIELENSIKTVKYSNTKFLMLNSLELNRNIIRMLEHGRPRTL